MSDDKTLEERRRESVEVVGKMRDLVKSMSPGLDTAILAVGAISVEAVKADNTEDFVDILRALESLRAARDRIVEARAHLAVSHENLTARSIPEPKKAATDPSIN